MDLTGRAHALRVTTKKGRRLFWQKSASPQRKFWLHLCFGTQLLWPPPQILAKPLAAYRQTSVMACSEGWQSLAVVLHSSEAHVCTWRKKHFPLNNLPPKMAAAFQGLITNAGLMATGMSYSYSSQKQTTSLYVYIWRHWSGGESHILLIWCG